MENSRNSDFNSISFEPPLEFHGLLAILKFGIYLRFVTWFLFEICDLEFI